MKRLALAALVVVAAIPYVGAMRSPLLYDDRAILDNRWLVNEAGPISVFQKDYWFGTRHERSDLYRPLTVLSLAWNVRVAPSREGVRAVNVAAHAAVALALFWMLTAIVSVEAALCGAALFAVHPLASEAVLTAVGRAEIFAAILGLVSFRVFVSLEDRHDLGGWRLAASAAAFLAALCFKEGAAAWLVIGAAFVASSHETDRPSPRRVAGRAAVYLGVFAGFVVLRGSVVGWGHQAPPFVDNPLVAVDGATRAANAVILFGRYVLKMVWPGTLTVDYGFDQIPVVPLFPWGAIEAAGVMLAFALAVVGLRRSRSAGFLALSIPSAFAVTGNFAFPIGAIFGERLAYTSLLFFCGLSGLALASIANVSWRRVLLALLVVACAARTIARGRDYHDLTTFNEATAHASPRAVKALVNAGRTRLRAGDASGARPMLERAVAIWPDYARAWRLLADTCDALGDAPSAAEARRRETLAASQAAAGDEPL